MHTTEKAHDADCSLVAIFGSFVLCLDFFVIIILLVLVLVVFIFLLVNIDFLVVNIAKDGLEGDIPVLFI